MTDNPSAPRPHGRWPPLVIDFTTAWSGPLCGAVLAGFGWDVVKIETASRPDVTRRLGPFVDGIAGLERSGYFDTLNRSKRSVAIDLANARGHDVAERLCLTADVVLENFSPGVMQRLGLGYEQLRERNPALVMASISGYGATGPESRYVAYGQTIEAASGVDAITGYAAGTPMACGAPIADQIGGLTAAFQVMAAIQHRRLTDHGAYLDISMLEAMVAMLPAELLDYQLNGHVTGPHANADARHAPHGVYPCRGSDRWVAIAVDSDAEWQGLCAALAQPDWLADERFSTRQGRQRLCLALDALLGAATLQHDAAALVERLRAANVPATEVLDGFGLQADATLAARGFYVDVETSEGGQRKIPGALANFSATPLTFSHGGPRLGEHTRAVLREVLLLDDAAIDELISVGALS